MKQTFKRALALSGGGVTGYLFEIGALAALDDLFDDGVTVNDFDMYMGVSAGAAAAALMAGGVKPAEIFVANLSGERPYYFERRDIFAPALGEGFMTVPRAIRKLIPFLKLYWRNRHEMSFIDLLEKLREGTRNQVQKFRVVDVRLVVGTTARELETTRVLRILLIRRCRKSPSLHLEFTKSIDKLGLLALDHVCQVLGRNKRVALGSHWVASKQLGKQLSI